MNAAIRGVAGFIGRGGPSERDAEQPGASDATPAAAEQPAREPPPSPQPETVTVTRADFEREVQSRKDRELVRERREYAKTRAEQGDVSLLHQLAEKGDGWAQRELATNGDTWALGEIKQRELQEQQARESDPMPVIAAQFDQSVLHPLLAALPVEDEQRIVGSGIVGMDGRQQAVAQSIAALKRHAAAEAIAKAMNDEGYTRQLLHESSALRKTLLTHPVLSKQLRAMFRGDLNEPDLNPGTGPGRGGDRENDVMNDAIRSAAFGALERGPDERAAGAGATNGRRAHLDTLDD